MRIYPYLLLIMAIAAMNGCGGDGGDNTSGNGGTPNGAGASGTPAPAADAGLDVVEWSKEFLTDAAAAKKKYLNKKLTLTGKVAAVEKAPGTWKVNMEGAKPDAGGDPILVQFTFHVDPSGKVKAGDIVSINGMFSMYIKDLNKLSVGLAKFPE